jgi:flagellar biosynthesis protein
MTSSVDKPQPDDLAIALKYDGTGAPRVTARGKGYVAEKILELAKASNIPIEEDPMLVEALASIPLEEEIPEELYKAVAEILNFIMRQARAKQGR